MNKEIIWEDCICGNKYSHSRECKTNHERNNRNIIQKEKRMEKRKKGLCIIPGCNCKGEIKVQVYQYCKYHRIKLKLIKDEQK